MTWTRRAFIQGTGAAGLAVLASGRSWAAAATSGQPFVLEARPGSAQLLEAPGGATAIWGYDGRVPGPTLRARRGEEVWVRLKNALPDPTTIHWHGIRIDNAMDGVAHLTQEAVPPGGTFDYRFAVPDAGTFWYHPHHLSWEQVARGLYGALIVEESDPVEADQDIVLIVDDWRLEENGRIDEASFGSLHDIGHQGRLGNVLTANGQPSADIPVKPGERVRLRLLNTCNARILALRLEDVEGQIIAVDGQPVAPRPLVDGKITLAPGQRIDLAIDMNGAPGATAAITETSQERLVIGQFVYGAEPATTRRAAELLRLPANAVPEPDLRNLEKSELAMGGGMMGRLQRAVYQGAELSMQDLARKHGQLWALNGVAGMPEKPLLSVPRGRSVEINMINDTRWQHAMHVHGHHFRETGDAAPAAPPWHDTVLIEPMQTRSFAFLADNPGKWMIHCHMLEHQQGGMGTWFEVT